jgi:hypothetical protein
MRLLSASIKCTAFILLFVLAACTKPPPPGDLLGDMPVIEGEVQIAGSDPFDHRLVLADSSGNFWLLICPELESELKNLAGHRIRVRGVVNRTGASFSTVLVDMYELLPVGGKNSIIGILELEGDCLVLVQLDKNERYLLVGPLKEAMKNFKGLRVCVWGEKAQGAMLDGSASFVFDVEGYNILGPGNRTIHHAPPGNPQGSHNR